MTAKIGEEAEGEEPTSTTTAEELQQPGEDQEGESMEPEETTEQKKERARTIFVEGKRHYMANSFADASRTLADACQIHVAVYGDFAVECADPYFYYGKALLELARMEPGVFSNALDGVVESEESSAEEGEEVEDEKDEAAGAEIEEKKETTDDQFEDANKLTEEEREELHEMVEDALEENAEALDQGKVPEDVAEGKETAETKEEEKDADGGEAAGEEVGCEEAEGETGGEPVKEEEQGDEGAEADKNTDEEEQEPETTGEGGEEKIGDESVDVSNLQLAWEMLDMARVICEKQEGEEWRKKLSECYLALGEVAIEDERYPKAIEDLHSCLEIQKEIYDSKTDRRIAETFFQIGRAQNLSYVFEEAAAAFKSALEVVQARKSLLESQLAEVGEGEDAREKLAKEIKDLEDLIPDVQVKMTDCEESQKSAEERKKEMEVEEAGEGTKKESTTTVGFEEAEEDANKAVSNITHLVRKPLKRKPEDDENEEAKRVKADLEEGEEGSEAMNGHANGVAAPEEDEAAAHTNGQAVPEEVQG